MNKAASSFSVLALVAFTTCGVVESEKVPAADIEEKALQVISDGTFRYTEKSKIKNVLNAGRLERWNSDNSSTEIWRVSEGFTLYIDGDSKEHEAVLSGGRGTYDADLGHLIAYDDVELINKEGEKLNTEYLVWSNDSDRVHTNRPVRIESNSGTLEGNGLEADSKFENYRILKPTGAFELP